jgi:hypothetical protein
MSADKITDKVEMNDVPKSNEIPELTELPELSEINNFELIPKLKPSDLLRCTSQSFRMSSNGDKELNDEKYGDFILSAQLLSKTTGQNFNEVMTTYCPTWNEDKWKSIVPEANDLQVGEVIETKNLFVCCNSVLNGMYNDTIGVFIDKNNKSDHVTYHNRISDFMKHSGDMKISYGLRHEVKFNSKDIEGKIGYIISAPWVSGKSEYIRKLVETRPIFEVCTEDDDVIKRYIIPQDFSASNNNSKTACVNAEITHSNGLWKIVLKREFINGFADDMETIVSDLRKMNELP